MSLLQVSFKAASDLREGRKAGVNVVSGGAAGVDRAAHASAARAGTTTVVLAQGLEHQRTSVSWRSEFGESVLVLSGFEPTAVWTPSRAMERNTHIAALSDAVVIMAAGLSGGSWAQGQLCLRTGKKLLVLDLPVEVAAGNAELIRRGATAIAPNGLSRVLDELNVGETGSIQLGLLG